MSELKMGFSNSEWTEGHFAYQIKKNKNDDYEVRFWLLGAERLGMSPIFTKDKLVLNNHVYKL